MDNNQFDIKKNLYGIIALGAAALSAILAILGTSLTCACSAKKTYKLDRIVKDSNLHCMSAVFVISIIAIIFAIGAIVVAILALAKDRTCMMAKIALIVGAFAFIYAFLPMVTVCGYNCMLNHYLKD